MKLNVEQLDKNDFEVLTGVEILTPVTFPLLNELSGDAHSDIDVSPIPFWATTIQDIVENKYVTYSEEDVAEGMFLGLRVNSFDENHVAVSLGNVGDTNPLLTLSFKAENGKIEVLSGYKTSQKVA
ncbi:hypothetical protein [Rossellomorea marisflavi]|uniref:hypothetical protein n=1 Tax=Rossellomorea marisflavi TaxID=189381 RepID=UPI003FA0371B